VNRRTFCTSLLATSSALTLGHETAAASGEGQSASQNVTRSVPNVLRPPDLVTVFFEGGQADLP
jgi:hypothetical protein